MDLSAIVGTTFDHKFEILSVAGAGGMGTVFKARQLGLERIVALKVLDPDLVSDKESLLRFEREAKSISVLSHPHIATFYSYGVFEGRLPYIVMEFLEGKSLRQVISDEGKLDWHRALKITLAVCQALGTAHKSGTVHRDIKPNNIILLPGAEEDFVKIVDFGLAKITQAGPNGSQRLTKTGELIGSVHYLSPEQCCGRPADSRSDIYSSGCVLYEMLSGMPPFEADNPIGLLHKHMNEEAIALSEIVGLKDPEQVNQILKKAMAKDASLRYQSMDEMAGDISALLQGKRIEFEKSKSKIQKKPVAILSIFMLFITLVVSFSCWIAFTDAGTAAAAAWLLKFKGNDRDTIIFCLNTADKLESSGKSAAADQIFETVAGNIRVAKKENDTSKMELYLHMASIQNQLGDKQAAGRWGLRALLCTSSFLQLRIKKLDNADRISADLNEAAKVVLRSGIKLNRSQAMEVIKATKYYMDIGGWKETNLFDLVYKVLADTRMPITEELADVLRARLSALAVQGRYKDLRSSFRQVHNAFLTLDGPESPRIPRLYFSTAKGLSYSKNKEMALLYIKLGKEAAQQIPDSITPPFAQGWGELNDAYQNLAMTSDAVWAARREANSGCRFSQNAENCIQGRNRLAQALLDNHEYDEAIEIAKETTSIIEDNISNFTNADYLIRAYCIEAVSYNFLGKVKTAQTMYKDAIARAKKDNAFSANLLCQLYDAFADESIYANDDNNRAASLNAALEIADKNNLPLSIKTLLLTKLVLFYIGKDDVAKAKLFMQRYENLLDTSDAVSLNLVQESICFFTAKDKEFCKTISNWLMTLASKQIESTYPNCRFTNCVILVLVNTGQVKEASSLLDRFLLKHSDLLKDNYFLLTNKALLLDLSQQKKEALQTVSTLWKSVDSKKQNLDLDYLQLEQTYLRLLMDEKDFDAARNVVSSARQKADETASLPRDSQMTLDVYRLAFLAQQGIVDFRQDKYKEAKISLKIASDELRNIDSPSARLAELDATQPLLVCYWNLHQLEDAEKALDRISMIIEANPTAYAENVYSNLGEFTLRAHALGQNEAAKRAASVYIKICDKRGWHNSIYDNCKKL